MLDKQTRIMLEEANQLTTEDIVYLKAAARIVPNRVEARADGAESGCARQMAPVATDSDESEYVEQTEPRAKPAKLHPADVSCVEVTPTTGVSQGAYERRRTRESKVSTMCVGSERSKHEWWPVGTELVGRIGLEEFTATVVQNPRVKSGRGIVITSGPAQGRVCITPSRAALEATEQYRQANNLGRGGGVTNGWTFWKPRSDA